MLVFTRDLVDERIHRTRLFVVQLLATNDSDGERYKLVVDGLDVTVGIEADAQEFIGDRERKRARYADEVYDDIVRYSAARDQL